MTFPRPRTILFVRLPGLLAQAAKTSRGDTNALSPLVVSEGRLVRDTCPLALAQGVRVGISVVQGRHLCPTLLAVPLEQVDASALRRRFLNTLADLSPVVELDGLDVAYVDMTGDLPRGLLEQVQDKLRLAQRADGMARRFSSLPLGGMSMVGEAIWNIDFRPRILTWHESCKVNRLSRLKLSGPNQRPRRPP